MSPDDAAAVQEALARAVQRRDERDALARRAEALEAHLAGSSRRLVELRDALAAEEDDVTRLERMSPGRIWSSLRGSRLTDLERETAERDAARYHLAVAQSRHEADRAALAAREAELAPYAGVDAELADALAAKDSWLRRAGGPVGAELAALAEEEGRLAAQERELGEAHAAAVAARGELAEARERLQKASSWSTWDTWGGGGMLTDAMKYDHVDAANLALHRAHQASAVLERELADVGMAGVAPLVVEPMTRTFDVWFDNIFTDHRVGQRIRETLDRTSWAVDAVHRVVLDLEQRSGQVRERAGAVRRRRQELLTG